jgi:Flp pilus assembly protein TadD
VDSLRRGFPDQPSVITLWGQYLLARGRAAEALPVLEKSFAAAPSDADLGFALGLAAAATGQWRVAEQAFASVASLRPAHYEAWLQLGAARLMLGDRAGADRALESAMRLPQAVDGRAAGLRRLAGAPR